MFYIWTGRLKRWLNFAYRRIQLSSHCGGTLMSVTSQNHRHSLKPSDWEPYKSVIKGIADGRRWLILAQKNRGYLQGWGQVKFESGPVNLTGLILFVDLNGGTLFLCTFFGFPLRKSGAWFSIWYQISGRSFWEGDWAWEGRKDGWLDGSMVARIAGLMVGCISLKDKQNKDTTKVSATSSTMEPEP